MTSFKLSVTGDKEMMQLLKKKSDLQPIRNIVSKNGAKLSDSMQRHMVAAYVKGYSKGTTRRSVTVQKSNGGLTVEVGPGTKYAPYVEYGTRFMAAEPAVRPAFNQVKPQFLSDLKK